MRLFHIYLIFLSAVTLSTLQAQKILDQGTLHFEVTDIKMDAVNSLGQAGEFLKSTTMTIYIDHPKWVTVIKMKGDESTAQRILQYPEGDSMVIYMDFMGSKKKIMTSNDDSQYSASNGSPEIKYFHDQRKTISGHDAYKVVITTDTDGEKSEMEVFVAEQFNVRNNIIPQQPLARDLKGLPLQFKIKQGATEITYTATSFTEKVDLSVFEFNESDYEKVPAASYLGGKW